MPLELTPTTPEGERLLALVGRLAPGLAAGAAEHDRAATFPHASLDALRAAGYLTAPIPQALGGLGVASVHDLVVAASRLAAADASIAIGTNMHLTVLGNLVRRHAVAAAAGDGRRTAAAAADLRAVVDEGTVIASAVSEPGQDITHPRSTAVRHGDGWRVDGRKIFCTMSPAATVFYTSVSFRADGGEERYGYARVPAGSPGVVVHGDWDALGMRASGSHTVSFDGVALPASALTGGFPVGDAVPYMEATLTSGLFHAAASLGVAEAADRAVIAALAKRPDGALDGRTRMLLGENAVALAACRAALAQGARLVDERYAEHVAARLPRDTVLEVFSGGQAVKAFINDAATRIVDRALACTGGAGYFSAHPLSRAYRDVRAGAFMHPLGANRAYDLLADLALGRPARIA